MAPGGKRGAAPKAAEEAEPKVEVEPDAFDRLVGSELPKATETFCSGYGGLREASDLLGGLPILPAKRLCQVVQHLRDLSWRQPLSGASVERLSAVVDSAMPTMRSLIELAGSLEVKPIIDNGDSPLEFLSGVTVGLEASSTYCVLVGIFGGPPGLVVEEIGIAVVRCLKQCARQVVTPLHSAASEGSTADASAAVASAITSDTDTHEAARSCIASLVALMRNVHEFLCRHRLGDEQLHQLVHVAVGCFFFAEVDFTLCAAAEDLLVTIFSRYELLRQSILQDFFVKAPKLPSGRRARKFQLPVAQDSPDYGLSCWTHLLLRLIQSTCLPLREPLGSDVEFSIVLASRSAAQAVLTQLTSGLVQRLLLTRTRDDELRSVLDDLIEEVLGVLFKPTWPGALAWIRTISQQLIGMIQPDKKKASAESSVREFSLKLLIKIVSRLCHHHVDAQRGSINLPSWDAPSEEVTKDTRLLQHVALRVSLEEGKDMPWTDAAKAVEAWDADLFLTHENADCSGLSDFNDDIVFRYLTLAHLEDERFVHARIPPRIGPQDVVSACTFSSGHPLHAWTFLVCDWAEAVAKKQKVKHSEDGEDGIAEGSTEVEQQRRGTGKTRTGRSRAGAGGAGVEATQPVVEASVLERLLAFAWTSRTPLCGEGSSWRIGGGRRVLLPFTIYKIYRQLRSGELEGLRRVAIDCLVLQANSPQASLRKTAMRGLSDIIEADSSVLASGPVEETIEMRLQDESSWVRHVSLDLLGRILEGSLGTSLESDDPKKVWAAPPPLTSSERVDGQMAEAHSREQADQKGATASAMLLRFYQTVRGRINDTSVLVRRQASKMLSAFVLNHPEHPDVDEVALDLLRRSTDSEILRNLVVGTFELLWFADEEPTPRQAHQLSRVVDASRGMAVGPGDILSELLGRFKQSMSSRKHGKGFEHAIRRWTTVLLHEFVQFHAGSDLARDGSNHTSDVSGTKAQSEAWVQRRSLLSTLEAFAVAQPREMIVHLRPLTVYLALDDESSTEEQWVAMKVCQILSAVLPYAGERRGLMDHRQVQQDLQVLIKNQPSSGVHEAVRCLCLVVKYVTGDLSQLLAHLNSAAPALSHLCRQAETRRGSLERVQQMYMSRQAWVLSSLLESLSIDDYIERAVVGGAGAGVNNASGGGGGGGADGAGAAQGGSGRFLPRSSLRFELVGGSVASTVADLLVRLYALDEARLQAVVLTSLGFFLKGQRAFVKERRVIDVFGHSLKATDLSLRLKVLETLASLLTHFGRSADQETRSGIPSAVNSTAASAIESAQPLAAFSDEVLAHITHGADVGVTEEVAEEGCVKNLLVRVRAEALSVVRLLNQQGLINPMTVLPKVFALCFNSEPLLAEPAGTMLKDILEMRPTLLLNRMDEAFRQAFEAAVLKEGKLASGLDALTMHGVPQQLGPLCEVYTERFRKHKNTRETFIRKALHQIFRLQASRFKEHFSELLISAEDWSTKDENIADSDLELINVVADGEASRKQLQQEPTAPSRRVLVKGVQETAKRIRVIGVADSDEEQDVGAQKMEATKSDLDAAFDRLSIIERCQLLYAQFIASTISSLPFAYESEPLLIIFECNRHLSLHAGALSTCHDQNEQQDDLGHVVKNEICGDGQGSGENGRAVGENGVADLGNERVSRLPNTESSDNADAFGDAVAIVTCIVLKGAMKKDYGLNAEQCAQFNPKDIRQERLKNGALSAGMVSKAGEEAPPASVTSAKVRFPVEEWRRLVAPVAANVTKRAALSAYIRSITDNDPWETSCLKSKPAEGTSSKKGRFGKEASAGGVAAAVSAAGVAEAPAEQEVAQASIPGPDVRAPAADAGAVASVSGRGGGKRAAQAKSGGTNGRKRKLRRRGSEDLDVDMEGAAPAAEFSD
eukprot:TRINITY_DN13250_c3_g1_i1.p1 TRINITY_DN13250_c3_g1~~TRINITY_DN13250_c3_g1_i1.p1  ORF type:complete len:1961 (+),score=321.36 TRINITY_DN13250_c3_g1_i1:222-5885(+)